ncbi:unnamed protein product [Cuscuta epithymum]|uniref:Cytochrome P450 n=1 Tax=Cuscuta epithymum TaxID=186058 RepID=A0AAV0G9J2_9ASTE|nr:unnamed protein product [Cuscuta epithymum]
MFEDEIVAGYSNQNHGFLISCALIFLGTLLWISIVLKKSRNGKHQPPLPPGPRPLPLLGNLLSLQPELHSYMASMSQVHGPIYTLWLGRKPGIVITSPSIAREVLKDQDSAFANRDVPAAGREATFGGKDIVWSPHGPEWRMLRKICVREMLSSSALDSVYDLRRREVRNTVKYLYEHAGRRVNVGEQMFLTVLNVITGMMWGGTMKGAERESLGSEFRQIVSGIIDLLGLPNVSDFYPGLARYDLQGIRRKMKKLVTKLDKVFERVIDQRLRMGSDEMGSRDFLQVLLKLKDGEGDERIPFTITHLKALLMDMVTGGTDTTANTSEFAMAEIMKKPDVLRKLHEELDTIVGKDHKVEESHIHQLPYLSAVMKETLRLHPVLPLLVPHSPSKNCIVGGYTVPQGARVFVNVWAIHRDSSVWENPLEFKPERFLDNKAWDYYSAKNFDYFPFGSGRRNCAGIASAERMFMYTLASVIHSFDWKLPQGETLELSEKFGIVLKKRVPLVLIPTPRLSHSTLYE